MLQKHSDEAEKFYSQALNLDPSSADALTGLVNLYVMQKQPAKALTLVQDQIAKSPNNSKFYLMLGQVELRNQAPDKAEAAFQKATELDPNNVPAFEFLASLEASRGSVDQAIAGYQKGIQANPKDVRLYVALGGLFETQDNWQQAEKSYQQALQVQPDYPVAANNLAYLMLEHGGDVSVALSLAQTARRGLPDLPASADTLGWAYYKQGIYNSAVDLLQQAEKANPKDATYHYHLGMAYMKTNNSQMADKEFHNTLQLDPHYTHADEIQKMLAQ